MYYIIETEEQLSKFSQYDFTNCFVDVIMMNDNSHPAISKPSLIYIRPFKSRAGFMLCINHAEAFSLPLSSVVSLLSDKASQIYAVDAKRLRYYLNKEEGVYCLKTGKYLYSGELIDESIYNTPAHRLLHHRYECKEDINKIIPIAKHYEKMEKMIDGIKFNDKWFVPKYYKLYGYMGIKVYQHIESAGIKIDNVAFISHYNPKCELMSVKSDNIYTSYNMFTATGRPSNAFNGINFSAMNKENGSRKSFIANNDLLVEFDYSSYHLRILAYLIGYEFEDKDIHTHIGKFYYEKEELTEAEYSESKSLTFKLLYTESAAADVDHIPFFRKVREFKNDQWEKYKKTGVVESFISKRPIKGLESKTQILPYILQNYETERNILIINDLLNFLANYKTKLVLYNYDSFLLDYSKADGTDILQQIQEILEQDSYYTSCSFGKNYQEMKKL